MCGEVAGVDSLEGVIGLVWLMFLVGSVLRAVVQGKRRAEQEAARRAMRRAQGRPDVAGPSRTGQPQAPAPPRRVPTPGRQVLRPGWPVYPGQPAQPVVVVEQGEGQGQVPGEGESIEGGDTLQPGMWGAQEDEYSTEGDGRDIRRQLRQERSDEWQREKARTWEMPADAGSLGAPGEAVDEPVVKSVDAFGVSAEWEMADWAVDEDTDAVAGMDAAAARRLEAGPGAWRLAGRVEPEHALAGIVWAAVLGAPRCRLTRHGR